VRIVVEGVVKVKKRKKVKELEKRLANDATRTTIRKRADSCPGPTSGK